MQVQPEMGPVQYGSKEVTMMETVQLSMPTHTTADALCKLAAGIFELSNTQALDSRFAAKLLKKLEKEAQRVMSHPLTPLHQADSVALQDALSQLRDLLNRSEASLLVQSNARLRAS